MLGIRGGLPTAFREMVMAAGTCQRLPTKVVSECHPKLKSIDGNSVQKSAHNVRYGFPWYTDDQDSCYWILFKMIRKWASTCPPVLEWYASVVTLVKPYLVKSILDQWETFQLLGDCSAFYFWSPWLSKNLNFEFFYFFWILLTSAPSACYTGFQRSCKTDGSCFWKKNTQAVWFRNK